ncbi:MAG: hypothetical protein OEV09_09535, partial [Deltaproteobacteria bacterium]|nr:hypothetical protein [Deltaproteobacteria bacterium]
RLPRDSLLNPFGYPSCFVFYYYKAVGKSKRKRGSPIVYFLFNIENLVMRASPRSRRAGVGVQ